MRNGVAYSNIKASLEEQGLEKETAANIVNYVSNNLEDDSGGLPGWLIWILVLIGINVLSAIFDWPFWVY